MRGPALLIAILVAGCGDASLTTADLYGTWSTGVVGAAIFDLTLAARDDGTHPELAGLEDIYLWSGYPAEVGAGFVQIGEFRIEDDRFIRVLRVDDGPWPAGTVLDGAIRDWSQDAFTLGEPGDAELTFHRQPAP